MNDELCLKLLNVLKDHKSLRKINLTSNFNFNYLCLKKNNYFFLFLLLK